MAEDQKNGGGTITIKKESLWKYSTFILIIILVIGAFLYFGKPAANNGTADVASNGGTNTGPVDTSVFEKNAALYPSIGPSDAAVTVIEFYDFQCPYCAIAAGLSDFAKQYGTGQYADLFNSAEKVQQLAQDGKVRLIYVGMSFLGQESVNAAEASLCANEQGKFFEMHDALFAANDGNEGNGKYNVDKLKTLAAGIKGIDTAKFNQCLDNGKYASQVSQINQEANAAGVQGTPTFYVNGKAVSAGWSSISAALKADGANIS